MRVPLRLTRVPVVLVLAGGLLLAGGVALRPVLLRDPPTDSPSRPGPAPLALTAWDNAALTSAITAAQQRLRKLPADWSTWAQLDWGRRAQQVNARNGSVYGVIADALTQLGDYPGAQDAVQRMLNVEPGVASFARASYYFEQHGQVPQARTTLQRALEDASDPSDIAFCRYYLGELAFNNGDPTEAVRQYERGLALNPNDPMLHAGLAKAHAALGQTGKALDGYDRVVKLLPLPHLLTEYGDLLTSAGRDIKARQQYDLVAVQQQLQSGNGVSDHLGAATFLADHGPPKRALA